MTTLRLVCRGAGLVGGTALVVLASTQPAIASPRPLTAAASHAPASAKTTVTEEDYFDTAGAWPIQVFRNYEKLHPNVVVQRTASPFEGYETKFLEQASSGALPDILEIDNPDLPSLASTGVLEPLTSVCHINTGAIEPPELAEVTYNGSVYALPMIQASIELFYNKSIFQAAHVSPPTTWAQLVSVSKTLTNSSHYGIGFAAQPTNGNAAWQFEPFLWSNGGHLYNLSATPAVQALALWTNLVKDGSAPKDVVNWTQTTVEEEFAAGKTAMMVNGPWNLPALNSIKGLNYGAVSIPTRVAGQTVIAPIGGEVWTIPKTNPAAEQAACGVLKYMETPSVVVYDATTNWEIPVIKTAFGQAEKVEGPKAAIFFQEALHGLARTKSLGSDALGPKYPKVDTITGQAIDEALSGQMSPQAAFASAAQQVKAALGS